MLPQIIVLALSGISVLAGAMRHGHPRKDYDFRDGLLKLFILNGLLFWGGFYDCFR